MAEQTPEGGKKSTLGAKPTLSLRGGAAGTVRQSFSHGRSKQVVVEVKKRRVAGGEAKSEAAAPAAPAAPAAKRAPAAKTAAKAEAPAPAAPAAATPAPKARGLVLRTLTEEEQNRRTHALGDARLREAEERKIAEEEAKIRAEREAIEQTERAAAEARKREEEERRKHDEATKKKADEVAKKRFGEGETPARPGARAVAAEPDEDEAPKFRRGPGGAMRPAAPPQRPTRAAKTATERPRGRLTLVTALSADEVRERSEASFRRRERRRTSEKSNEPREKLVRDVTIPEAITIGDLAKEARLMLEAMGSEDSS